MVSKKELIVKDLQTTDMTQSEIARKYGVSKQYVSAVAAKLWGGDYGNSD